MSLSMHGETLFHFTEELETLISILSCLHFRASLSMERLSYVTEKGETESTPDLWVPMVSFCDYKLAEIAHHTESYGCFGLGMSKTWGTSIGLNPELYVSDASEIGRELRSIIYDVAQSATISSSLVEANIKLANMFSWTKNYQGVLRRKGKILNSSFRFADDKEWRYVARISYNPDLTDKIFQGFRFTTVPDICCSCQNHNLLAQDCPQCHLLLEKSKEDRRSRINDGILDFTYNDINFIVVNSYDNRDVILDWIDRLICSVNDKLILASKIIVIEALDLREVVPIL